MLGHGGHAAALALGLARAGHVAQAPPQRGHAVAHQAPVGLELRLAGAAGADAAAEPLEVLPQALLPGVGVLELRQLDLELALGRAGVLGEDVEDDGRAVDHPRLEPVLQRALLARAERSLGGDQVGLQPRHQRGELLELAAAQVGPRLRAARGAGRPCPPPRRRPCAAARRARASRSSASSPSRSSEAITMARSGPRRTSSSSGRAAEPR